MFHFYCNLCFAVIIAYQNLFFDVAWASSLNCVGGEGEPWWLWKTREDKALKCEGGVLSCFSNHPGHVYFWMKIVLNASYGGSRKQKVPPRGRAGARAGAHRMRAGTHGWAADDANPPRDALRRPRTPMHTFQNFHVLNIELEVTPRNKSKNIKAT